MHVIQQVAVEGPIADCIGGNINGKLFSGLHYNRVLAGFVVTWRCDHIKEHPVQVYGVRHHRIVDECQPQPFALIKQDGASVFSENVIKTVVPSCFIKFAV